MKASAFLGAGLHSALGSNVDSALQVLRSVPPNPTRLAYDLDGKAIQLPYFVLSDIDPNLRRERQYEVLYSVIQDAIAEAGLSAAQVQNMGLCLGTSSFEIALDEQRYLEELNASGEAIPLRISGLGDLALRIRREFNLSGEDYTFNTACTSSANAAWYASKLVEQGLLEHVLVVAVEFINDTTVYGFNGLQLLSQEGMRPFDERRNGLVLGEACAALVIGEQQEARAMKIRGGSNLCDTHSMSTTQEDGGAVADVIERALANAGLSAADISVIKCHGTATFSGDLAEARGMLKVFSSLPRCLVLKPFTGHTLGACGLTEMILFYRALQEGFLPTTPELNAQALGFQLDFGENVPEQGNFMLNFFGFGGNNTSLILSNEKA